MPHSQLLVGQGRSDDYLIIVVLAFSMPANYLRHGAHDFVQDIIASLLPCDAPTELISVLPFGNQAVI